MIQGVIEKWINLVKGNKTIPRAWLKVTADNRDAGAVVFVPRNIDDKIDTMLRDPCENEEPIYLSTGATDATKKKIGKDGKFKKAGILPLDPPADNKTIYENAFSGNPKGSFANGQCSRWIDLPATQGSFSRLRLTRSEVTASGSPFSLNADGAYAFDLNSDIPLIPNSITTSQAESAVRQVLSSGFTSVPSDLETFGVFPGSMQSASTSIETGFEVLLEQRHNGLTVFNSEVYALVTPSGETDLTEVVFYDIQPTGSEQSLISASAAAEIAAADLLARIPMPPCRLTDIQAFYGFAQTIHSGVLEVRPVWGLEFNLGEVVYTIDGVTGAILSVEVATP